MRSFKFKTWLERLYLMINDEKNEALLPNQDIEIRVEPEGGTEDYLINPQATISAHVRKTLDGKIILTGHEDIDIVVIPGNNKIVAYPKRLMDDKVWGIQDKMFKYLAKRGIVSPDTIQGGNVYFSLEAQIEEPNQDGVDPVQIAIFTLAKWIEQERPYFEKTEAYKDDVKTWTVRPPKGKYSTELGKVPHAAKKGSITPSTGFYGWHYNYSIIRENLLVVPKD